MEKRNVIAAIEAGGPLAPLFPDLGSWTAWQIFVKALYGLPMGPDEAEIFTACTGRSHAREGGYNEGWAVVGRRGGKSRTAAIVALYEAVLGDWQARAAGEEIWIHCLAVDKSQAAIVLNYIRAGLDLFPGLVKSQGQEEIHLANGIAIGVKAASLRGLRGYTSCLLIADEAAFWRDAETSANPFDEILTSILPGLLPGGKPLVISTPWGRFGTFYDTYKEHFGAEDSDVLVWQAASDVMNPTLSEGLIKRLLVRSKLMRSEFDAAFRDDVSNLFPEHVVEVAMDRELVSPNPKFPYVAFIDPSGGASDSMTMAIALATREGHINVCRVDEREPPFDPKQVAREFSEVLKRYGIRRATADRYGGVWPSSAFKEHGIVIEMAEMTASQLYLEFSALLNSGVVHLPRDDERLKRQLQSLERRTAPGGKDRVEHPPQGHDDRANAVAGACVLAAQNRPWSAEEVEARLPVVSAHRADKLMSLDLQEERQKTEHRRSNEDLLDEFMKETGCSRIVRPKKGWWQ